MATDDCPTRLADAKAKLHRVLTGGGVVEVQYADRRVRYTQANVDELRGYVNQLEQECGSGAGDCVNRRRPIGFRF